MIRPAQAMDCVSRLPNQATMNSGIGCPNANSRVKAVAPASPIRKLIRPPQKSPSPVRNSLPSAYARTPREVISCRSAPTPRHGSTPWRSSSSTMRGVPTDRSARQKYERAIAGEKQSDDLELIETQGTHRRMIPFASRRGRGFYTDVGVAVGTEAASSVIGRRAMPQIFSPFAHLGEKEPRCARFDARWARQGLRGGKSWPFAADGRRQILAGCRCRFDWLQS